MIDLTHVPSEQALIKNAAAYWKYTSDDLAIIHALAARDPEGLRLALVADPLQPFYTSTAARSPLAYDEATEMVRRLFSDAKVIDVEAGPTFSARWASQVSGQNQTQIRQTSGQS